MELPSQSLPIVDAEEEVCIRANQQLQGVLKTLQEARKVLRRDWDKLPPRKRSTQSRLIKELEEQQRSLEDEIETNSVGCNLT